MQAIEDHPLFRPVMTGLLLAVGVGLLGLLLIGLGKDLSLWVFGRHARAVVVDQWAEQVGDRNAEELSFRYYVRYRFMTPDGRTVTTTKRVAVQEWAGVGFGARGRSSVDFFDGTAKDASAPVYQEHEHVIDFDPGSVAAAATLDVVYFPLYPAHNRLQETRFIPLLACLYVPLLVMAALALAGARHVLRLDPARGTSHRAKETPWQLVRE